MTIILYTTTTCPACNMLKKFLDDKQIEYEMKIIGRDITQEDFYTNTKSMSVPVLDIDGQQVVGLDLEVISKLLHI